MCEPVSIGIAVGAGVGAAGAAITGGDPLQGAIFGGVSGGFGGAMSGPLSGLTSSFAESLFFNTALGGAASMGIAGGLIGGVSSTLTGVAMQALMPPQQDYSQYYQQTAFDPIAYNTQQSVVTGSGGRQASANLAEEIKRAKNRRAAQADVGDIDLATSLSNTGLQIA